MRRESEIGSIRAGKLADFAVLEQAPYEVGVEVLNDIDLWGTVLKARFILSTRHGGHGAKALRQLAGKDPLDLGA